jgi:hypothetical protein
MFALALVRLYYSALLLRQTEEMVATRAQGAKEALRPKEELGSKRLRSPEPAIILVMSSRTDRSRRDAIRETWANGRRDVKFLVGRYGCDIPPTNRAPHACEVLTVATDSEARDWNTVTAQVDTELDKEMQQHNDTLLLEMVDEYRTLPLKLKLGYAWAVKNTDVSWIIKTDDDVYLRPAAMQAWFGGPDLQLAPRFTMVAGGFVKGPVLRKGKWRELKYPLGTWPAYPLGATHAATRALAQYVADRVTSLVDYEGEDVSMAVWMAQAPFHREVHLRPTELFYNLLSTKEAASCILDTDFLSTGANVSCGGYKAPTCARCSDGLPTGRGHLPAGWIWNDKTACKGDCIWNDKYARCDLKPDRPAPENRTTTNPLKALSVSHNIDPERMRACYQHEIKGSGLLIKNT